MPEPEKSRSINSLNYASVGVEGQSMISSPTNFRLLIPQIEAEPRLKNALTERKRKFYYFPLVQLFVLKSAVFNPDDAHLFINRSPFSRRLLLSKFNFSRDGQIMLVDFSTRRYLRNENWKIPPK